ncbi:DUF5696 domain-containing protein [Paenibacillus sp. FSL W7-1287]|uniref:DUF5696 domain-containing protein n=1 Tax=Paenibacillus sp. FSL W7-1287 TaxID=2954538 RepID=UPI0030F92118
MKWAWNHKKWIGYGGIILLLIILISQMNITWRDTNAPVLAQNPDTVTGNELEGLPNEKDFVQIAENDILRLKFDELTGHFMVEDKRNSNVWRSYPDPEQWDNVGIGGGWLTNLQSTVMFQHIDFSNPKANPRESNAIKELTKVIDVQLLDHGVEFKLDIQKSQFIIPVRIIIQDDYVETTVIDDGIEEIGNNSLLWLRLYPFFSAVQNDENGYLFIPDGSGALISFQEQRSSIKQLYQERVYGADTSFISSPSSRNNVLMPVYGLKSGDKAFIAVIHKGAEYSDVVASPSSVFSNYNWIGSQQAYRMRYRQVTNAEANRSFETYTKDSRFDGDRVTRYYLLDTDQADYVGMASTYRRYLMEEYELDKITPKNGEVPLYLSLLGADREKGLITDRYVKATTTSEAMQIVQELYGLGVENMVVNYTGWQKDGYSSLGGYLDVDKRIGGNQGMRHFIEYADSLDIPVFLDVNYSINTTAATGFRPRHHGVRDLSGTIMSYSHYSGDQMTLSSRKYIVDSLRKDLSSYQKLGITGLTMSGIGHNVSTDYNSKFGGTRTETIRYDQEALRMVKENVGSTHAVNPGFYTLGQINHIDQLADDYSYDLFSSRAVPFAQIVLHGLITYTSAPENNRSEFRRDFLRDIEYGAYPSFDFTMVGSEELIGVYWYTPKNSSFNDWKVDVVEQYQRYNEALKDVQDQFIAGHRELASGVMETEYENGKKVVVNYNRKEYSLGQITVPAMDYIVIEGGKEQ